jgi:hypothetical protein
LRAAAGRHQYFQTTMPLRPPTLALLSGLLLAAACAHPRPRAAVVPEPVAGPAAPCASCTQMPSSAELMSALALRVADLRARGGACMAYGRVLEGSLAGGRIVVRPYMWHVGTRLASAQAMSTGEIDVAREVDSLNVGVRRLGDVVHSVEHEAAHIAFSIPSGLEWNEALVDERVAQCGASTTSGSAH